MAAITPQMVKELRDKTDAGMLECKKALQTTDGDMEAAVDYLRKAGIAKSEKRADRTTKEGKVFVLTEGAKAVMVEVLCETDFVASNEKFFEYVQTAAKHIMDATTGSGDVTAKAQEIEAEDLAALFTKFGEKMILRRALRFESNGQIGSYLHAGGKVGVMVDVEGECDAETLKNLCLHIAAYNPVYVCSCEVPESVVEHEKEIARAILTSEGKPAAIIEKIIAGKIAKYFTDVCLLDQPWIHDDKSCFKKLYPKAKVVRFARWAVGQEID